MRHSIKKRDNVAESRPGSNTDLGKARCHVCLVGFDTCILLDRRYLDFNKI